jgi:hypothetical protein
LPGPLAKGRKDTRDQRAEGSLTSYLGSTWQRGKVALEKLRQWKFPELLPDLRPRSYVVVWLVAAGVSALLLVDQALELGVTLLEGKNADFLFPPAVVESFRVLVSVLHIILVPVYLISAFALPFFPLLVVAVLIITWISLSGTPSQRFPVLYKVLQLVVVWIITAAMILQAVFYIYVLSKIVVA